MQGISTVPYAPPKHVAIIMDGNGRWAKARGLPRTAGHRKGVEAVRRTVEAARELGIPYLTMFGFSSENWRRPEGEVFDLMQLLRFYLRSEIAELHKNGVRLRVIGDRSQAVRRYRDDDREGRGAYAEAIPNLNLIIALSYGSRQEIADATRQMVRDALEGRLRPEDITEESFSARLLTRDIPDPDLLVRTSGEQRISNFLLWQSAYTELVFVDTLWPDFTKRDLEDAIREFNQRDRRYGAVGTR